MSFSIPTRQDNPADFIIPAQYPRRHGVLSKALSRAVFKLIGWRVEGVIPDVPKLVISVAPHTTNWDFVIGVLGIWALDLKLSYIAKHTIFIWPFSIWLKSLGGIPVNRASPHGVVGEVVAAFAQHEKMILALAPEGTRTLAAGFKTGFIHMARGANVPILLAYFDFSRRVIGFGKIIYPSGDTARDLAAALEFYRPIKGRYQKDWQK